MNTCAYCGSEVNQSYCAFCEMQLTARYILDDGERLNTAIKFFPEKPILYKFSTV